MKSPDTDLRDFTARFAWWMSVVVAIALGIAIGAALVAYLPRHAMLVGVLCIDAGLVLAGVMFWRWLR